MIFAQLCKRWKKLGESIEVFTNEKGLKFCENQGLEKVVFHILPTSFSDRFGLYFSSLTKTLVSTVSVLGLRNYKTDIVLSSSDFWPDVFPAIIYKLRNKNVKWISCCYLVLDFEDAKRSIKGLIYFCAQKISLLLILRLADSVFVASSKDVSTFTESRNLQNNRIMAVRGGVDFLSLSNFPKQEIVYDAIFVGRFHPQKCIEELIDIWGQLVKLRSNAHLAIVGSGNLEKNILLLIKKLGLQNNIQLLGVLDGKKKTKVLKSILSPISLINVRHFLL